MASKAEILNTVTEILTAGAVDDAIIMSVAEVLRPKAGGKVIDLSEVTQLDELGELENILCSISGVWLPATEEYFYADKAAKEGNGLNSLKRISKQGESIKKAFTKAMRASEKGIMADFTSGDLDPEEAKQMLAELATQSPDYSSVGLIVEETETEEA